jgi:hypothetical protein
MEEFPECVGRMGKVVTCSGRGKARAIGYLVRECVEKSGEAYLIPHIITGRCEKGS